MTRVYSPKPVRGLASCLIQKHTWSVGRAQFDCYHYDLPEADAEDLIRLGKAKELTTPFLCLGERR